jgi:hypothetical protein
MLNEKKKPRKHLPCKSASAAGFEANLEPAECPAACNGSFVQLF